MSFYFASTREMFFIAWHLYAQLGQAPLNGHPFAGLPFWASLPFPANKFPAGNNACPVCPLPAHAMLWCCMNSTAASVCKLGVTIGVAWEGAWEAPEAFEGYPSWVAFSASLAVGSAISESFGRRLLAPAKP